MKRLLFSLLALTALCAAASAAPLELARDGKTDYVICHENSAAAPIWERDTAADLAAHLSEITGAKFTVSEKPGAKNIYLGRPCPGDDRPMAGRERRIAVKGDDLYLWGEGDWGASFAAYDLLDRLGCRWYSFWGDRTIPKIAYLVWKQERPIHVIPSFETYQTNGSNSQVPAMREYARRNRIYLVPSVYIKRNDTADLQIGPTMHGLSAWLPTGNTPVGKFVDWMWGAHPLLADQAYFKTHPEYFSMVPNAHRYARRQLCFSNPEVRKILTRNVGYVLSREYDGKRSAVIGIDVNDTGGPICCCSDCRKLEEKYASPGGPYFDYLLELGKTLEKKYPKVTIRFIAYLSSLTEIAPKGIVFPKNILPCFTPLATDFSKPMTHPFNRPEYASLGEWSKVAPRLGYFLYPNPYPFPAWSFPVLSGIRRIAADLRTAKKHHASEVFAEPGGTLFTNTAFKEMQIWITTRLVNDLSLDENELVREFCRAYYGKAAGKMVGYITELEELAAKDPVFMSYQPDQRTSAFLTADNLLKWEKSFDEMEKLVADSPRHALNVSRARLNLDLTVVQSFPKLRDRFADPDAELAKIAARHRKAIMADLVDVYAHPVDRAIADKLIKQYYHNQLARGLYHFMRYAKGPVKPLPAGFDKPGAIRMPPDHIKQLPSPDPAGAFGISSQLQAKRGTLSYFQRDLRRFVPFEASKDLIAPWNLPKLRNDEFKLYYIGRQRVTRDSLVRLAAKPWRVEFFTGYLYDPADPGCEYDFYLSLRTDDKNRLFTDQLVLVKSDAPRTDPAHWEKVAVASSGTTFTVRPADKRPIERGALHVFFGDPQQRVKVERALPASLKIFPQKNCEQVFLHTFRGGGLDEDFGEIILDLRCEGDGTLEFGVQGYQFDKPGAKRVKPLWVEFLDFKLNGKTIVRQNQTYSKTSKVPGSKIDVKSGDLVRVYVILSRPTTARCELLDASRLKKAGQTPKK